MSIYKIPHGWKVDLRRHRVGEKLFRDTATFDTKTEAEAYLKRLKGRLEEAAKLGLCMPSSVTLSEALDDWWSESKSKMAPSSLDAAHTRMKMWQASHLAQLRLTELTRKHLKGWIEDRRQQGRAASTIKNDLHILQAMFKYLKDDLDWHMDNPVDPLMRHVKIHNARHRRLSEDEYRRLSTTFMRMGQAYEGRDREQERNPRYTIDVELDNGNILHFGPTPNLMLMQAGFQAAIECAMRRGRLFSLKWEQVNFKKRIINMVNTGPDNKPVPIEIPISPVLTDILHGIYGPNMRIGAALKERVFGTLNGDRAYRYMKQAAKALGIENLTWHDLRHEACSRLADLNWEAPMIQAVSGHKTLQSLQRYVHIKAKAVLAMWEAGNQRAEN